MSRQSSSAAIASPDTVPAAVSLDSTTTTPRLAAKTTAELLEITELKGLVYTSHLSDLGDQAYHLVSYVLHNNEMFQIIQIDSAVWSTACAHHHLKASQILFQDHSSEYFLPETDEATRNNIIRHLEMMKGDIVKCRVLQRTVSPSQEPTKYVDALHDYENFVNSCDHDRRMAAVDRAGIKLGRSEHEKKAEMAAAEAKLAKKEAELAAAEERAALLREEDKKAQKRVAAQNARKQAEAKRVAAAAQRVAEAKRAAKAKELAAKQTEKQRHALSAPAHSIFSHPSPPTPILPEQSCLVPDGRGGWTPPGDPNNLLLEMGILRR